MELSLEWEFSSCPSYGLGNLIRGQHDKGAPAKADLMGTEGK